MPRPSRVMLGASLSALLSALLMALAAAPASASFLAPETAHSPNADEITTTYWVVGIVTVVLGLAINVGLVMAVMRFRAARGVEPARVQSGRGLQRKLIGGFSMLALALFVFGIVLTERTRDVAASGPNGLEASLALSAQTQPSVAAETAPLEIAVIGQRWLWRFEYPGHPENNRLFSYEELVVPVDTTVVLHVTSTDVLHRWWVPSLGGKVDAVPGQTQDTWFKADEEGVYEGQSAAFSGPSYPTMQATVRVVSPEEYQAWLDQQAADLAAGQKAVALAVEAQAKADEAEAEAEGQADAAATEAAAGAVEEGQAAEAAGTEGAGAGAEAGSATEGGAGASAGAGSDQGGGQ